MPVPLAPINIGGTMQMMCRRRTGWSPILRIAVAVAALASAAGCATPGTHGVTFSRRDPTEITEVAPGKLYRSAQPNLVLLQQAIDDYGIRTVINLRGGEPDPDVGGGQGEREFCESHGVRYVHLPGDGMYDDVFPDKEHPERSNPAFVEEFLGIVNGDGAPVLIHCAGGKHRTGFLTAVYRLSVDGWSLADTYAELFSFGVESEDFRGSPHIWRYLEYLAQQQSNVYAVSTAGA